MFWFMLLVFSVIMYIAYFLVYDRFTTSLKIDEAEAKRIVAIFSVCWIAVIWGLTGYTLLTELSAALLSPFQGYRKEIEIVCLTLSGVFLLISFGFLLYLKKEQSKKNM